MSKKIICIDIGAGSARTYLAKFDGSKIQTVPVHRFLNKQISLGETVYFDFFNMISHIKEAIAECFKKANGQIDSIGVDSFGGSFGLLDKDGDLLANPISYRDSHYLKGAEEVEKIIPIDRLDGLNMSKTYTHCTLFLLSYLYKHKKQFAQAINRFLPIANLVSFYLGGEAAVDPSGLSGSQFFNVAKIQYIPEILEELNIDSKILPEIRSDYTIDARLRKDYRAKTNLIAIPKISLVCSHDTASCTAGLPLGQKDAFIISGTWSVIGLERKKPVILEDVKNAGFTNWNGYKEKYLFVKIYSGFYFFQEFKKVWQEEKNQIIDDDEFFKKIPLKGANSNLLNLHSKILFDENFNMRERIMKFFELSGQSYQADPCHIAESIIKSIIMEYRIALHELETACANKIEKIYITGGGSKNLVFCSWLSAALSRDIISGYTESAINGNLVCQLINAKELSGIKEARTLLKESFEEKIYSPSESIGIDWDYLEEKYMHLKKVES